MKYFRKDIWENDEYAYPAAYGFMPNLHAYLHDDDAVRECMLVVPGGGYCMVASSEGEIVAKTFYEKGMNAFVLTYTTDITMSVPLMDQPLKDISRAVRVIRKNCNEYRINPDRLFVCGFSAAGHLCGSLATHYDDVRDDNPTYMDISNRPTAAILSYPVITTGEYTHIYSIQALLGKEPSKKDLEYFSIDKNVKPTTPPCFLWQTAEDSSVPVENSYLMAMALRKAGVPFAHYVFPKGFHGLSVATEAFFKGDFGEPYTSEQTDLSVEAVRTHTAVNVSKERHDELMIQFYGNKEGIKDPDFQPWAPPEWDTSVFSEVKVWPDLAEAFLHNIH